MVAKKPYHFHTVKSGDQPSFVVRCYHKSRSILLNWQFWAGTTFGFPFEHFLYEHVWPFYLLTHLLHL